MAAIEICLIVAGLVLMVGSFFVVEKLSPNELDKIAELSQEEVAHIVDKEIEASHSKVQEQLETELEEVLEKFDRESDKETNEKIMAISEYSDTVIESINKTHNEIMFLYSMLGDKHKEVIDFSNDLQDRIERMQKTVAEELTVETMRRVQEEHMKSKVPVETHIRMEEEKAEEVQPPSEEEDVQATVTEEEVVEEHKTANEKILELYQQGMAEVDIAKELEIGLGVVRLVVDFYNKKEESAE